MTFVFCRLSGVVSWEWVSEGVGSWEWVSEGVGSLKV